MALVRGTTWLCVLARGGGGERFFLPLNERRLFEKKIETSKNRSTFLAKRSRMDILQGKIITKW